MMKVILALGTNLGNREDNLREALRRLSSVLGNFSAVSDVIETGAVGFQGPDFLNQAVQFECTLAPGELLAVCKRIEKEMGRDDIPEYGKNGRRIYHNRIIDIDILYFGDLVVDTPDLRIPHPQVETRPYVKELLADLSK